jgi:hypothetical protein
MSRLSRFAALEKDRQALAEDAVAIGLAAFLVTR